MPETMFGKRHISGVVLDSVLNVFLAKYQRNKHDWSFNDVMNEINLACEGYDLLAGEMCFVAMSKDTTLVLATALLEKDGKYFELSYNNNWKESILIMETNHTPESFLPSALIQPNGRAVDFWLRLEHTSNGITAQLGS